MLWFGEDWGAPVCKTNDHTPTPEGHPCGACTLPISASDQGLILPVIGDPEQSEVNYHLKCFLTELGLS